MSIYSARYRKRTSVMLGCLCLTLALASCATPSVRETPTPSAPVATATLSTPTAAARSIAPFSCAAGSLPVTSRSTQTSCTVSMEGSVVKVTATYTFTGAGQFVDESKLMASGWVLVGLVNQDGGDSSGTWFLYLNQGAWISWGPAHDGQLGVWASVPEQDGPIACGKTLTGDSTQHLKVPLPQGTQKVAIFLIAPFCPQDIAAFYMTTLTASAWTPSRPFQVGSTGNGSAETYSGTFTHNGVSVDLYLTGADGTSTAIEVI